MKTGIALEGGAMRGMFTCGILDVLMENNIYFDTAVGVSAGAAFGCNYKSRQIGRGLRYNKRFCRDPRYVGLASLLFTGNIYNAKFDYYTVPRKLDVFDSKTFAENPMEFYIVATDIMTGKPVYRRLEKGLDRDMELIRASASMPGVSKPVKIDDLLLLDGGTSDSIPLRFLETLDCERRIVITTQPKGYVKKPTSMPGFLWKKLEKYPELVRALKERHEMYNETLAYIEKRESEGEVYVIRPPEALNIKQVCRDPDELERVYRIGREECEKHLGALREFIGYKQ